MNEPQPDNEYVKDVNPIVVYRAIGLFVLANISGILVFLFHQLAWPWFAASFVLSAFSSIIIAGIFFVPPNLTVAATAALAGLLEGVYQGWQSYGLLGAALGAIVGVFASVVFTMFTLMTISAVVILCGGNPFVNAFSEVPSEGGEERPTLKTAQEEIKQDDRKQL